MRYIFPVLIMVLFASCVSLKTPKRTDLETWTSPMLIGKYPVRINQIAKSGSARDTVFPITIWYMFKNSEGRDSAELAQATHMELRLVDKKHVSSTLFNGEKALKTDIINGHLKNGYFRKKHNLSLSGIPPFYWALSSNKMQFALGKEKQLYIDQADETNGSILIIMAGTPGFTRSYTVLPYKD
ncbi:MAG: hypothetical protein EOO88_24715 [Pedobacter sp.]|nr:MAG: hypothetical protein EOO88_24715 [Pedobacter sp.]